jgi:hypothetical protein
MKIMRLPMSGLKAIASEPASATGPESPQATEHASLPVAENALLVRRLEQVQQAIRTLDAVPRNSTASALLDSYKAHEQRLAQQCRRASAFE